MLLQKLIDHYLLTLANCCLHLLYTYLSVYSPHGVRWNDTHQLETGVVGISDMVSPQAGSQMCELEERM